MSLLAALDRLRVLPLDVRARAVDEVSLPAFAGSTLRGAFGHALKDAVCVVAHRDCAACSLVGECAYPALFEPAPPPGALRLAGQGRVPAPYVLRPPRRRLAAPGEELAFGLTLVGRAVGLVPVVAAALVRAAERGVTADRRRFAIERILGPRGEMVLGGDPPALGPASPVATSSFLPGGGAPARVRVAFPDGVRVIAGGTLARALPFAVLVRALLWRAATLLELHEGVDLRLDFRSLVDRASAVRVARSNLRRADSLRWSTRQERAMNLRGVRGVVEYAGDLEPFLPLLALGAAVGVGKGTTFGLGRMVVRPVPEDASVCE